ncbi:conserved oligomeric Golgi complex component [Cichlidogyrus casuarinus]|uniref:Conserved oligomeric Golgi complex subunit 8 n=1 Tax=Cichlidogyrus casuarinus TaxID=1844966 RepID=A0ABD2QH00_9PLAT
MSFYESIKAMIRTDVASSELSHIDETCLQEVLKDIFENPIDDIEEYARGLEIKESSIRNQNKELASKNYASFLSKAKTIRKMLKEVDEMSEAVSLISTNASDISSDINSILEETRRIHLEFKEIRFCRENENTIYDLLDLPQLMSISIRNGYYDDAMDIMIYVLSFKNNGILRNHSVPLLESLVEKIEVLAGQLFTKMLENLRLQIDLPTSMKIILSLQKMKILDTNEIKFAFLVNRSDMLHKTNSPENVTYEAVIDKLETFRIALLDIVSQFKTVCHRDLLNPAIASTIDPLNLTVDGFKRLSSILPDEEHCKIFNEWLIFHLDYSLSSVDHFLKNLILDISSESFNEEQISNAFSTLKSLQNHCLHFANAFTRIGYDLRPIVVSKIREATYKVVKSSLQKCSSLSESAFADQVWSVEKYDLEQPVKEEPLEAMLQELADFPPIQKTGNSIIAFINSYALIGIISSDLRILRLFLETLTEISQHLVAKYQVHTGNKNIEIISWRNNSKRLAQLYSQCLIPFLVQRFVTLFLREGFNETIELTLQDMLALGEGNRFRIPRPNLDLYLCQHVCKPLNAIFSSATSGWVRNCHHFRSKEEQLISTDNEETDINL